MDLGAIIQLSVQYPEGRLYKEALPPIEGRLYSEGFPSIVQPTNGTRFHPKTVLAIHQNPCISPRPSSAYICLTRIPVKKTYILFPSFARTKNHPSCQITDHISYTSHISHRIYLLTYISTGQSEGLVFHQERGDHPPPPANWNFFMEAVPRDGKGASLLWLRK